MTARETIAPLHFFGDLVVGKAGAPTTDQALDVKGALQLLRSISLPAGAGRTEPVEPPAAVVPGFESPRNLLPAAFRLPSTAPAPRAHVACSAVPHDWRVLSSARFTSPWPLHVATAPCNTTRAIFSNCSPAPACGSRALSPSAPRGSHAAAPPSPASSCGLNAAEALYAARLYWAFPDGPLPPAVLALKARQDADAVALYRDRVAQWLACARSCYTALLHGELECFYVMVRCFAACVGAFPVAYFGCHRSQTRRRHRSPQLASRASQPGSNRAGCDGRTCI